MTEKLPLHSILVNVRTTIKRNSKDPSIVHLLEAIRLIDTDLLNTLETIAFKYTPFLLDLLQDQNFLDVLYLADALKLKQNYYYPTTNFKRSFHL